MNSSDWLLTWLCGGLGLWMLIFVVWELLEAADKSPNSLTASQRIIKMAKEGNLAARIYIMALPVLLVLIGVWLLFHWWSLCINFGILCEVDI